MGSPWKLPGMWPCLIGIPLQISGDFANGNRISSMAAEGISRFANRSMTWPAGIAFLAGWAALAGLSGPFGTTTSQPDILLRIVHFGICAVVAATSTLLIEAAIARVARWPSVAILGLAATLAAIPTTFAVRISLDILSPVASAGVGWPTLAGETLAINLLLSFLARRLLGEGFLLRQPSSPHSPAAPIAEFLPPEFRTARILAVQADDHYLRIHTDRGATLIHLAIGEAEQLLAAEDGIRTHRSYWVARSAVASVVRKSGRMSLELKDGASAPVARARMAAVDEWWAKG
jgi:LytTr DNA-binding domain